jgi:dTDP-glucose 4,6-dehydratase
VIISNCSNNYGERQHEEKLIPKIIKMVILDKKVPIYGDGSNVRDWLYVKDHANAIFKLFQRGKIGETYCIGGNNEMSNLDLAKQIIINVASYYDYVSEGFNVMDYIEFVEDRKGHDYRYGIDYSKIKKEVMWKPETTFRKGLSSTIDYYIKKFGQ